MISNISADKFRNASGYFIALWEFNHLIQAGIAIGIETKTKQFFPHLGDEKPPYVESEKLIIKPFNENIGIEGTKVPFNCVHGYVMLDRDAGEEDMAMLISPVAFVKYGARVNQEFKRVKGITGYNASKTLDNYLKWWKNDSESIQTSFTYMAVESCLNRLRDIPKSPPEMAVIEGSCPERDFEKNSNYKKKIAFKAVISGSMALITFYKSIMFDGKDHGASIVSHTYMPDIDTSSIVKKINETMKNLGEADWQIDRVMMMKEEKELF
jgi:hypothetical protein